MDNEQEINDNFDFGFMSLLVNMITELLNLLIFNARILL